MGRDGKGFESKIELLCWVVVVGKVKKGLWTLRPLFDGACRDTFLGPKVTTDNRLEIAREW